MMFPSSVRRVVSSAPQSSSLAGLASAVPRATTSFALSSQPSRHQRRCSSSKPSSPADGPNDIPARPAVPAASSQSAKSSGEKRKPGRKPKDPQASAQKLPSVPSTQHLPLDTLALSTFFSQHRPISITHSLPKETTDDAFASIFLPRSRSQKNADVISTLSRSVSQLEAPMASLALQEGEQADENLHRIELKHADGTESTVYMQLNAMSGQFLPFQPPPMPNPETENAAAETGVEQAIEEEAPQTRVYKAILTIEEQVDANGQITIKAHTPQIVEDPPAPRTFLERMAVRQLNFDGAVRQREKMQAISVRRQKKLKMKKKKYKKLMKRTRNERRKLDRL